MSLTSFRFRQGGCADKPSFLTKLALGKESAAKITPAIDRAAIYSSDLMQTVVAAHI